MNKDRPPRPILTSGVAIAVGGMISYFYPEKPYGYENELVVPGVIGALVGYFGGYWLRTRFITGWIRATAIPFTAAVAIVLNIVYYRLISFVAYPPWYGLALYACFFFQIAFLFAFFGILGLALPQKRGGSQDQQ